MSTATYRAGIIGLGFIGAGDPISGERIGQRVDLLDGHHASALSQNPRVKLVAGCDLDAGRRERFTARTGATTYTQVAEMLECERLDIVSVATYTPSHSDLVCLCAEKGVRAIYCEKPIATSIVEAERMIAACNAAGALLVINHNRRFNPNYRRLRALIAEGGLGTLTSVSLSWATGRLGCVGTHLIDSARMLTGREVLAVSASLDLSEKPDCRGPEFHDPGGWGVLRMDAGLMCVVNAPNAALGPAQVVVEGTRGRAITGGDAVDLQWFGGMPEHWAPVRSAGSSMDLAVAEIADWLDQRGAFSTPAEESLRTLQAIVGFHVSHAANAAWIPLPLSGSDREYRVMSG